MKLSMTKILPNLKGDWTTSNTVLTFIGVLLRDIDFICLYLLANLLIFSFDSINLQMNLCTCYDDPIEILIIVIINMKNSYEVPSQSFNSTSETHFIK